MNYIKILIKTLENQNMVLKEMLEVTKEQTRLVELSNYDEELLEQTLNRKEVLIAKLNQFDDGFTSVYSHVRKEVKEKQNQYTQEVRRMQELIKKGTELGNAIKVQEERNRDKMIMMFSNQHKKYNTKKSVVSITSQYNKNMNRQDISSSYFLDKKN